MNRDLTFPVMEFSTQGLTLAEIGELVCLSFPKKLWRIVESDHFNSISWNDSGDCVIIEEDFFQREVLDRKGLLRIFETSSLKSFIRQLNLYGFSKMRKNLESTSFHLETQKIMVYRNSNFRRDCPFLIQRIKRRVGIRNGAPVPKTKRAPAPKRQESKMTHYNRGAIAKKGKKMLKKSLDSQKNRSHDYHALPTWSLENSTSPYIQNLPQIHPNNIGLNPLIPQEPPIPIGTPIMGLLRPSVYPDLTFLNSHISSLTSLYNPWFAMFMGAASTVPQSGPSDQQVSSSVQPCPVCNAFHIEPSDKSVTSQSPQSSSD